jgi:D-sedoheptulose 7-phosphate isomerase
MDEINNIKKNSEDYLENSLRVFKTNKLHLDTIIKISNLCINSIENGNKILFCGNGGSASDANHLAAEIVGRFLLDRQPLPAVSLSSNPSVLTALSNDFGYQYVFSKQVEAIGKKDDVIFLISTSGSSENIIEAARESKKRGIKTVIFTGSNVNFLERYSDFIINVDSDIAAFIQQSHITIGQLICYNIENYYLNK